jgi:hypothetical protein
MRFNIEELALGGECMGGEKGTLSVKMGFLGGGGIICEVNSRCLWKYSPGKKRILVSETAFHVF